MLGPPGAGKGTVSKMVQERFAIPQISTGDILRKSVQAGTELGLQANEYMKKGALVPDEVVIGLVRERIREGDCKPGFVLDGFPRTVAQADALEGLLKKEELKLDAVFSIDIPTEELVKRMSSRRTCRTCGAIYSLDFASMRPKKEGVCDKDGGELYQREDEKAEVIRGRLVEYEKKTAPLVDYYKKTGLLKSVTGETSKAIYEKMLKTLGA